jgi:hypothetical protein
MQVSVIVYAIGSRLSEEALGYPAPGPLQAGGGGGRVKLGTRILFDLLVRLLLLFFAVYFAVTPEALPGSSMLARIGISAGFLVLVVLTGEVSAVRSQLHIVLTSIMRAKAALRTEPTDDREAIDTLVRTLRSSKGDTHEKVLKHLKRLTGQDLPDDAKAWEAWWEQNREGFRRKP